MSVTVPNSKSPVTHKNIDKALTFLEDATASASKAQVKGAIAFLEKVKQQKTGPGARLTSLIVVEHIITHAIDSGQKVLASQALDQLEKKTKPDRTFRNLVAPTTIDPATKSETIAGSVVMQIKRRDGQNFVYTKPAPQPMMATRSLRRGMVVTDNRAGGKNLRFGPGKDIVGSRWERTTLDHILPTNDPRRQKLLDAGFDLAQQRDMLVLKGQGDKHPTIILDGAGTKLSTPPPGLRAMRYPIDQMGVTVLCTEVQFVPFKEGNTGGGGGIVMRKPVVYLYPPTLMDVRVEVRVDGNFVAQYPKMKDGAWTVKAGPTGEIFDPTTEKRFPYLFWEAKRHTTIAIDSTQAFCVKSRDAERFLEDAAAKYALNDRERTDFVTYWLPALEKNPHSLVQFLSADEYDRYAEMSVTPKPDSVSRLFMVFQQVKAPLKVGSPTLPQRERRGFSVIEWGGANLDEQL
jgi:hypothetical protein